ncbi:MAG: A/G-specific adenine glycosylase [bacterium]|nr:A/G-specific adenine glycosylase [bacterium]
MIPKRKFNAVLFRWYKKYGRHDLPWRHTKNPYHILVSEMMLQQTQVSRALLKYREFLRRFPTVAALANAPLGDVLRTWSGLGYNRRARYLHDCAKAIVARASVWPKTFSELLELPGVGPSTAAAISSFAFGADEPMIDTNIRRIIARVFFRPLVIASEARQSYKLPSDKTIYALAKTLIPREKGREWNWAMMDVGALLCKARMHNARCPFQILHGPVADFVYKKPQTKFAGSDRYYRGRILAQLVATPKGLPTATLRRMLALPQKKLTALIALLMRESLLKKSGRRFLLP